MGVDGKLYGQGLISDKIVKGRSIAHQKYLYPPFSVWNTRERFWIKRRSAWIKLGIKSELGRGGEAIYTGGINRYTDSIKIQTSVFDPIICELCYKWFARPGAVVIDPFAGGSVRGVVASVMGMQYWGCDLNQTQIEANKEQLNQRTTGKYKPIWICGDSLIQLNQAPKKADFIFSCPPYGNLEVYSDDPADISNMEYEDFLICHYKIIKQACKRLKNNSFAAFVVANFRDKKTGNMRNFVGDTITIFEKCGLKFYNDIVLINQIGTGAVRANKVFVKGGHKVVKLHQNVLVFIKGSAKKAVKKINKE